jgi:hypothetical protein
MVTIEQVSNQNIQPESLVIAVNQIELDKLEYPGKIKLFCFWQGDLYVTAKTKRKAREILVEEGFLLSDYFESGRVPRDSVGVVPAGHIFTFFPDCDEAQAYEVTARDVVESQLHDGCEEYIEYLTEGGC